MSTHGLALHGGSPVRDSLLPYGRQSINEEDIEAVAAILRSDWLTTGPNVGEFERAFAAFAGTSEAVAVSSGTAALHATMFALDIKEGDEVIVPDLTFAASANCVMFQGGTPIFADVDPDTLLLDVASANSKITSRTKAIIAVDYAGQPCDYEALRTLASRQGLALVADACHSLGGACNGNPVGSLADLNAFSLHPVKPITTGEGGIITCDDATMARRIRAFRSHGITSDHRQREQVGSWFYEMMELGYNYRITDFQCALGLSQLRKLPIWVADRQRIAATYDRAFGASPLLRIPRVRAGISHAYHLYVVLLESTRLTASRDEIFKALRAENIGVNVHYIPVHLHPFYRDRFGLGRGHCPMAENAYEHLVSLPIFPAMTDNDVQDVIEAVHKVLNFYAR